MNTQTNPKTFHQVPGPCCTIMRITPNPVPPLYTFHQQLTQAKSKAEVIDILIKRGSTQGWWSDLPEGLWERLEGWRARKQ